MAPAAEQWSFFLERCFQKRVRSDQFARLSSQLLARTAISGRELAELLLKPRSFASSVLDPLAPAYLEHLLGTNRLDVADILVSAFKWSRDHPHPPSDDAAAEKTGTKFAYNPVELDEFLLQRIGRTFSSGERPQKLSEARTCVVLAAQWMSAMVSSHATDTVLLAMEGEGQDHMRIALARVALGSFVAQLLENPKVNGLVGSALPKHARKQLSQALAAFVPILTQTSMHVANRLEVLQKQLQLTEEVHVEINGTAGDGAISVAAIQLETVIDSPIVNTRAGLFIFLNALLAARPLTDDSIILNYLHSRYKADVQSMTVDLISASFDVLSNGMYRHEPAQAMFGFKSFLVNKIPILLTILSSSMFLPLTPEFCITQALSHVDTNAFPPFSQAFDMSSNNSDLSDVRQDFLISCALHQLIQFGSIERLLGEPPMATLPADGKYTKEDQFAQCCGNYERVEVLLNEIERMDGNAGAIAGAVTEVIRHLCNLKETMTLKTVCNSLSRRPLALDIIMQFCSPVSVLQPLCSLLDSWRYDEDQGEYQPVYDEFSAVLLLVLAFAHRFELSYQDIGLANNTFVAQLLQRGHASMAPEDLTEAQSNHLGGWLKELFDPDGKIDEIMSSCRPQEFYLLVPTLLNQTVLACSADVLSLSTIENGLEYLSETSLLPSLVGGVLWMTAHLCAQTHTDHDIVLKMLGMLIKRTSSSNDTQALHGVVLSIISRPLERCLRSVRRRDPARTDLGGLLDVIKPYLGYEKTTWSSTLELEAWAGVPGSSLRQPIKSVIQSLCIWSSAPSITLSPPSYTHRLFYVSLKVLGAKKVLRYIVEEVKAQQQDPQHGPAAMDVATALICAPSVDNSPISIDWVASGFPSPPAMPTRLNLRSMLKVEYDNAAELATTDMPTAEIIVRLHRRVEAQLADAHMPSLVQSAMAPMQDIIPDITMGMGDASAASVPLDQQMDLSGVTGLDLGDATGLDLGGDDASALGFGTGDLGGGDLDDNIFAGLPELDGDMDF